MNPARVIAWLCGTLLLTGASLAPARADCVSDCEAATYCDSEMHASGECSEKLNECYRQECNRTHYGAIAYGAESGAYGWSNDLYDAPSAESQALVNCRRHGNDCAVVVDFWNSCAAVAADGSHVAYGLGDTERQAESEAVAACSKEGSENCAVQAWACTGK